MINDAAELIGGAVDRHRLRDALEAIAIDYRRSRLQEASTATSGQGTAALQELRALALLAQASSERTVHSKLRTMVWHLNDPAEWALQLSARLVGGADRELNEEFHTDPHLVIPELLRAIDGAMRRKHGPKRDETARLMVGRLIQLFEELASRQFGGAPRRSAVTYGREADDSGPSSRAGKFLMVVGKEVLRGLQDTVFDTVLREYVQNRNVDIRLKAKRGSDAGTAL